MALDAITEAAHTQIGAYEPQSGADLDHYLETMPDMLSEFGSSFSTLADRLGSDFPVDPSFVDMLRDLANVFGGASDSAGEVHAAFRARHESELNRIENPRPNERLWDVSA